MGYLIRLGDDEALDPQIVGFKFASLARASRDGFSVPAAVAVSTRAHKDRDNTGAFPASLAAEIRSMAAEIELDRGISVRSSATLEDLGNKSFAGIYESYLNVRGEEETVAKIERCWQSARSEQALAYLEQTGIDDQLPAMGVILQRMIQPVAAGVAFSSNPLDPRAGEVVIEAVPGLADELVSGTVTPTRVFVGADGAVGASRANLDHQEGRVTDSEVSLDPRLWQAVAEMARASEQAAEGTPQDIEWAIDRDQRVWLLQTRPITTLEAAEPMKAPPGSWTRAVAVDLWADRLTPFLAEAMVVNLPRYDFSEHARKVGLPVVQPAMAVIDGYLYVNCDSLKATVGAIPRKFRISDLKSFFPPGFDFDSVPAPKVGKLVSVVCRSLVQALLVPQSNILLCESLSRRGLRKLDRRLDRIGALSPDSPAAALEVVREARESLALMQERNQWPYLYATVLTFALRWLAVDRFGLEHGEFLEMISRRTDNVTQRIESEVRSLAAAVQADPELQQVFGRSPAVELASLPAIFRRRVETFLTRYGYRARHRAIHFARWAEAPEELLGMIDTLARSNLERKPAVNAGAESGLSGLGKLSGFGRLILRLLDRRTARYLDLREDLRFFLDKVLYSIRRSLLELGRQTGLGESVFFFTDAELEQVVSGELRPADAVEMAETRRRRFDEISTPPTFVVRGHAVEELAATGDLLKGVGTSPGRVTGRARIVQDPTRSGLRDGDILVARNTDPGWTPVLSVAGGVVVEEGGLLNHCSIVARELGIPAVVGVRGAVDEIPEGAEITIDGNLGVVQLSASEH